MTYVIAQQHRGTWEYLVWTGNAAVQWLWTPDVTMASTYDDEVKAARDAAFFEATIVNRTRGKD